MEIVRRKYLIEFDKWWKNGEKEALVVLGVKNVGKTSLVMKWAKDNNVSFSYFNEKQYELIKDVFEDSKSKTFDTSLAIINKLMIGPLNELIIFDGIRPGDELLVQLKKLCSNSNHRYIVISDYGEFAFDKIRFVPVGSFKKITINPLTFSEYCELKFNKYMLDSLRTVLFNYDNRQLPFMDLFENAWEEYTSFGGFPGVLSNLTVNGKLAAYNELRNIKSDIEIFVKNNINFSSGILSILDNINSKRSKTYNRFVFSSVSKNGTYSRHERAVKILEKIGLVKPLFINSSEGRLNYCDLFLCDPGLEQIWGGNVDRHHIIESIIFHYGIEKGYYPYRLVLNGDRIIDIVYDDRIPYLLDVKLKNTNSKTVSAHKFDFYIKESNATFKPFILVDKGVFCVEHVSKAAIMPVWAFLLMEEL